MSQKSVTVYQFCGINLPLCAYQDIADLVCCIDKNLVQT